MTRWIVLLTGVFLTLGQFCWNVSAQLVLKVHPILVTGGGYTPATNFFADVAQRVWDQAGITIQWQTPTTIDQSLILDLYVTSNSGKLPPEILWDPGTTASTVSRDDTAKIVDMWFVRSIHANDTSGANIAGYSNQGGDGMAIAEVATTSNFEEVVAHEIGHNLGLGHVSNSTRLMDASAHITAYSQVSPTYTKGILISSEITTATSSSLLTAVPEPAETTAAVGLALLGWVAWRRIKAGAKPQTVGQPR